MEQNKRKSLKILSIFLLLLVIFNITYFVYNKAFNKPQNSISTTNENDNLAYTDFPLENRGTVPGFAVFECKVEKLILNEIDLGNGFTAMISADCWYLDASKTQQRITVPLIVKGPNGDATVNGLYYPKYDFSDLTPEALVNILRIQYWSTHKDDYDSPENWINGGDGNGVDLGKGDILSLTVPLNYLSEATTIPGYIRLVTFGKNERQALYSEESYSQFVKTGDPKDLERTEAAESIVLPKNYLWTSNILDGVFYADN